jgi:hypothetical protein
MSWSTDQTEYLGEPEAILVNGFRRPEWLFFGQFGEKKTVGEKTHNTIS